MAYPKELRNKLGISLDTFATLINCSPGQLSMTESGKRQLPATSLAILAQFEEALTTTTPTGSITTPGDEDIAFLKKELRKGQLQLDRFNDKAATLAKKWDQANCFFSLAEVLNASQLPDTGNTQLQMTVLKRQADQKLRLYRQQWHKLQLAIVGLTATMAAIKKLLS